MAAVLEARAEAMAAASVHQAGVSAKARLLEGVDTDLRAALNAYVCCMLCRGLLVGLLTCAPDGTTTNHALVYGNCLLEWVRSCACGLFVQFGQRKTL
jgi:hypothetical protein